LSNYIILFKSVVAEGTGFLQKNAYFGNNRGTVFVFILESKNDKMIGGQLIKLPGLTPVSGKGKMSDPPRYLSCFFIAFH